MLKGLGDLANLMKNAREIQGKVEEFKESLSQTPVEGLGGGGLVRIQGRADGTVVSVSIDESVFEKDNKNLLEDLTLAAINAFEGKVNEVRKDKLTELTGGMGLPEGMDLGL